MTETCEKTVLGAALDAPGLWLAHAQRVTPELFSVHYGLANAICELTATGKPTDPRTVAAELEAQGTPIKVSDLLALADHAPLSAESLAMAVEQLHETARRRAVAKLARKIASQAQDPAVRTDAIMSQAMADLVEIGARSTTEARPMANILHTVMADIGRPRTDTVRTGINSLDAVSGGLKAGELIVLGARPSMGKTALALNIIRNAAQADKTAVLFSLEMSAEQVCHRILSDLSDVNLARIATHRLSQADMTKITNAANKVHKFRVFVGETGRQLDPVCRQIKHCYGLDLVVIDYLQLMQARARSREQEVAGLSRSLKILARQLDCPVLVLSQLNREIEKRSCKRPQLSDLRESGAIEQDADVVLLLWRPGYYDHEADQGEAELIVAKQRNGPTGLVPLRWEEHAARFSTQKSK